MTKWETNEQKQDEFYMELAAREANIGKRLLIQHMIRNVADKFEALVWEIEKSHNEQLMLLNRIINKGGK